MHKNVISQGIVATLKQLSYSPAAKTSLEAASSRIWLEGRVLGSAVLIDSAHGDLIKRALIKATDPFQLFSRPLAQWANLACLS